MNATGGLNFNLVGPVCIEFDTWFQLAGNDVGQVEVSLDGGAHWTVVQTYIGNSSDTTWLADPEGWLIGESYCGVGSSQMQFRFRFISNATGVNRGWFVDNIAITDNGVYVFGPDPALTFTKFYRHETQFGCWWQQPWIEKFAADTIWGEGGDSGWFTAAQFAALEPSWGVYDPIYFDSAYHNNLDTAVIWTLDVPTAFYGWVDVTLPYDTDLNDHGYVEISTDNGATWTELDDNTGSANDDFYGGTLNLATVLYYDIEYWGGGPYNLEDYLDVEQVLIQFRFTSDAQNLHDYAGYSIMGGPCFYGMEDNNAPVTTAQMTGTFDETCHWYTSCVKIKLTATDDITGVAATYYELDGVQYTYTSLVSICTDGTHTFCYWSVDNEGNVEEKICLPEFRIDMSGPTVSITGPATGYLYLFGKQIMPLKSGKTIFIFGGIPVTATATASDNPVEVVQFYLDGALMAEDSTAPYSATLSTKHSGAAEITVTAIDGLGRSASDSLSIDKYFKLF